MPTIPDTNFAAAVFTEAVIDPAAAPTGPLAPHDFLVGKRYEMLWADGDVIAALGALDLHLEATYDLRRPMPIAVDVETCAGPDVVAEYEVERHKIPEIQAAIDALPARQFATEEQEAERQELLDRLQAQRNRVKRLARQANKAGLHVHTGQVRLVQLYWGGELVLIFDRFRMSAFAWSVLGGFLGRADLVWVGHNIQFDCKMLACHGVEPARAPHCTMLQDHALTSTRAFRRTLAALCERHLGKGLSKEMQASDWARPDLAPEQLHYAAGDVVATFELWHVQTAALRTVKRMAGENAANVYHLMRRAIPAVTEIMVTGLGFDAEGHRALWQALAVKNAELQAAAVAAFAAHTPEGCPAVLNPGSNVQVAAWIDWMLANRSLSHATSQVDDWPRTETGARQVGKDVLVRYRAGFPSAHVAPVDALIAWADVRKASSTFGEDYAQHINHVTRRIHASFRIGGTETGRFSVTEPGLQLIDRENEFRRLFVAREGHVLVACDYGQIEVRVPAALARDEVLLAAIEAGLDVHTLTALACFRGQHPFEGDPFELAGRPEVLAYFKGAGKTFRTAAKAAVFGLLFGQGPTGLAENLTAQGQPTSKTEAERIQRALLAYYPGLRAWIVETRNTAKELGLVWTPGGRVYQPIGSIYTKAINSPAQGGAAEIMLYTLTKFPAAWGELRGRARLVHVVHDELVAEVPEPLAERARQIMTDTMFACAVELFPTLPRHALVEGGIGRTWADAK